MANKLARIVIRLKAIWELTRLEHGFIYGLGVLIALAIGKGGVPDPAIAAAGVAGAVLAEMGAFALNDYFDVEVDIKNNRTDRPIVRGDVSKAEALWIAIATSLLSVVAMYFTGSMGAVLALIFLVLFGALYNARLKEYGIWGNVYISFTMAAPFIFGSMLFANNNLALYAIAAIAFVVGLGREIMKGIMDMEGDALRDVRTVARTWGPDRAKYMAVALYVLGMLLSPLPLLMQNTKFYMSPVYGASALVSVAILAYVCYTLLKSHDVRTIGKARKTTLASMAIALLGVLLTALL
ncbi:putative (S)-2,3-Di-O-geranylgeranylglyceryl phosphate synthase [Methanocella paludicola SANAE]|uniref:(S)-2,3-Di-O-geranylgeranylglyceryl phosphate synthase n=1 Tax=Methanocella paludicola (strain DSM 17711 / JCM 13418 / NBRC 101707 / SANAE) TaxID=304371 RepID=D1Z2D2_METPS|nr:UbiA family prenyltransferase [Methanocella paludicola]BAI62854.1 putative (S)-2,3-Di-O-geranylgeranylglyceryl phosphate synthase [Methanocella paludicola SANAE]